MPRSSPNSPSASQQFMEFRKELARLGTEVEPGQGPRMGRQRSQPQRAHRAQQGPRRARARSTTRARSEIYAALESRHRAHRLAAQRARADGASLLASSASSSSGARWRGRSPRSRASPKQVAGGATGIVIPYADAARRDRRAGALDRRVPAGDAAQRGAQPHRRGRRRGARRSATSISAAIEAVPRRRSRQALRALGQNRRRPCARPRRR